MAPLPHTWPRRTYVDGPFGQIHVQTCGEGSSVILLHQAPMSSNQFENVYLPLAKRGYRVVGVDMPGFGFSDPAPGVPTIADYAQVVPAVLDGLDIDRAAVIGHHTGALVATEAALQFFDRVIALVVNGPVLVTDEIRQTFLNGLHQWEISYAARPHAAHMVELFDIRDRLAKHDIPASRLSDYVAHSLIGRGAFWHGHHAAYMYDLGLRLPLVRQPGLILTNTGDNIFSHAAPTHELRPDFDLTVLEGGGIDIVDQQPEQWCDAVAAFLKSKALG